VKRSWFEVRAVYFWSLCAALLLALSMSGCISVQEVDTLNKRFAAFEISYKQTLVEVESLLNGNMLKPETKQTVAKILEDVNKARAAAYVAKGTGNVFEAKNQLDLALKALDFLKATLPKGAQL